MTKALKSVNRFAALLQEATVKVPDLIPSLRGQRGSESLATWFIGPKGENADLFADLLRIPLNAHLNDRKEFYPEDPAYVTDDIRRSDQFVSGRKLLQDEVAQLSEKLTGSVPFWSYRYQGHMNWDITIPSIVGYFAGMLYNPNNVAAESSPVTTLLEMEVGQDLCSMLGLRSVNDICSPWAHITCDGSVANIEALWAARNLKFFPAALSAAVRNDASLHGAKSLSVSLPSGKRAAFTSLTSWELLNLEVDTVLGLSELVAEEAGVKIEALDKALQNSSVQSLGIHKFTCSVIPDIGSAPVILAPSTMHYSWPKGAALLGLGAASVLKVEVDKDARMCMIDLREKLDYCLSNRVPVLMVVVVLGSTEESAVDPLCEVVHLRQEFKEKGLTFVIHVDAAWGGYFASMLSAPADWQEAHSAGLLEVPLSSYVRSQFEALELADSITVDPHKAGYCAYPAGALCYKNGAMRNLVSFTSPIVFHNEVEPTVGVYGVEGSKPGAAAAGVWLSHKVIRTDKSGYGRVLSRCLFNSKRLYAALIALPRAEDPFSVTLVQRLPAERRSGSPQEVEAQIRFVKDRIANRSNEELIGDPEAFELFKELGSDQLIVGYVFNHLGNRDIDNANELNMRIYQELSFSPLKPDVRPPLVITQSVYQPQDYGGQFVQELKRRMGFETNSNEGVCFLLSTTMDPWVTDTERGSFVPELVEILRDTVRRCI